MNVADLNNLEPIAYSFRYKDTGPMIHLVPTRVGEPQIVPALPSCCPVAAARGAIRTGDSHGPIFILETDGALTEACQQCEGLWVKAHGRVLHITGATLARWAHLACPQDAAKLREHIQANETSEGS